MEDSSYLEKMGRELKCPICLSLLNSAVSLTCNHVFCNACILKSMKSGSNCPVCKVPYQRREARPAPHMDNLVSIYKSMEAASGFNIFVTQNPAPEISLDNEKRIEKRVPKKEAMKKRGLAKSTFENSDSVPLKPSFPTKKRVLVPQYPPSEIHILDAKVGSGLAESSKDESSGSVFREKDCSLKENEPVLSPFFWLRDEDVERSTQLTDGDQFEYTTPPEVPSFSDIKDSDDEGSHRLSDQLLEPDKLHGNFAVNLFDSEMFEWTQRACSPELLPSPLKTRVAETSEPALQSRKTVEPSTNNCICTTTGLDTVKEMLHDMPSFRTKVVNKKTRIHNSRGKGRKDKKNAQRRIAEHGESSSYLAKTKKESKVPGLDDLEADGKVSYVSPTTENGGNLNQKEENMASSFPARAGIETCSNEYENLGTGKSCRRASAWCQQISCLKSKKQKANLAKVDVPQNQTNEKVNVQDDSLSISAKQPGGSIKRAREVKTALSLRSDKGEGQEKKMKVSFSDDTKQLLSEDHQQVNSKIRTKRLSQVVQDSPAVGMSDASTAEKPSSENGVALRKCETSTSKIKCAFCQSTEESEASGELVHYYNGKSVPLDYNSGSKVIHSHKNCTEWAPNVYFENDEAINLKAELSRSKKIKCCCCELKGAALGCYEKNCRKSFHVPCAKLIPQCRWDTENFVMLCPLHASAKLPNGTSESQERRTKRVFKSKLPIPEEQLRDNDAIAQKKWISCGSPSKMILCCSALTPGEREIISEFEKLSGVTELKRWDSRVTHIIASTDENGACKRTLKFLMGIMEGKWILNINWVKACIKDHKPVDELPYEISVDVHGIRDGPRLGRLRLLNKRPKLFDGFRFYMMGDFESSYKGYLQDLIIAAGGNILHRKPISDDHGDKLSVSTMSSTFIIYSVELPDKCNSRKKDIILTHRQSDAEALASSTGAKAVSNSWVLNSISACKLQTLDE